MLYSSISISWYIQKVCAMRVIKQLIFACVCVSVCVRLYVITILLLRVTYSVQRKVLMASAQKFKMSLTKFKNHSPCSLFQYPCVIYVDKSSHFFFSPHFKITSRVRLMHAENEATNKKYNEKSLPYEFFKHKLELSIKQIV